MSHNAINGVRTTQSLRQTGFFFTPIAHYTFHIKKLCLHYYNIKKGMLNSDGVYQGCVLAVVTNNSVSAVEHVIGSGQ